MQRLYSTFPNSWPGTGLLVLRLTASLSAVEAMNSMAQVGFTGAVLLRCGTVVLMALLLLGLYTPVVALAEAAVQVCSLGVGHKHGLAPLVAAGLSVGLSMLGPGAWSIDALLFGRRRVV